jgi:hypothetical protein
VPTTTRLGPYQKQRNTLYKVVPLACGNVKSYKHFPDIDCLILVYQAIPFFILVLFLTHISLYFVGSKMGGTYRTHEHKCVDIAGRKI